MTAGDLTFVSYDLLGTNRDYQSLYDELDRLGAKRILLSVWALKTTASCEQLRDHLAAMIGSSDRLICIGAADWASLRAMVNPNSV